MKMLIMIGFEDKIRSFREACDLFDETHLLKDCFLRGAYKRRKRINLLIKCVCGHIVHTHGSLLLQNVCIQPAPFPSENLTPNTARPLLIK